MFVWWWEVTEIAIGGAKELVVKLRLTRETLSGNLTSRHGAFCMDSDGDRVKRKSPNGTGSHDELLGLASPRTSSQSRRLFAGCLRISLDKRRSAPGPVPLGAVGYMRSAVLAPPYLLSGPAVL